MITPATPASTDVFVVGDGTFTDHATVALVERCGFTGSITTAAALAGQNARAVIFRDEPQLARILAIPTPDDLVLIGLDTPPCPVARGGNGRRIVWIDGPLDHSDVQPLLRRAVGDPTINRTRVHTTPREREILGTYVFGATVSQTAARHFVTASTVRTHYRRVSQRYIDAGRPASNKSLLLLEMVADGWLGIPASPEPHRARTTMAHARGAGTCIPVMQDPGSDLAHCADTNVRSVQ